MTNCKIVSSKNGMHLVEWSKEGHLRRAWVTESMIVKSEGKSAVVSQPERGVPYGVEWERVLPELQASTSMLAEELKKRGVWTIEDLRASSEAIRGALMAVYGVDVAAILVTVRSLEKEQDK